jgi:hypothetical protein
VARSGTAVTVRGKVNLLRPDGEVVAQDVSARSRPIMMVTDGDRVVHESEVNTGGQCMCGKQCLEGTGEAENR